MKSCEKVHDMWALIDAAAVQCIFIGIFEKLVAIIMTETFHWLWDTLKWYTVKYLTSDLISFSRRSPYCEERPTSMARVTAFSSTSLFLVLFWSKFWISFKFHIPVSETYRPKNDIFSLLIKFSFPFRYRIRRMLS